VHDDERMMEKKARNFREYPVWQEAVSFSAAIYKHTSDMPWFERKGICDQLQRAVVSIPSNIAEGSSRPSDTEFAHFLDIALGSAYEVETQLLISHKIGYLNNEHYKALNSMVISIESQLGRLIRTLRT
jgi:four helix bundle protein